jgi:hypothetical protein
MRRLTTFAAVLAVLSGVLFCSCSRPPITDCTVADKGHRSAWTQFIWHTTGKTRRMQTIHHPARWWVDVTGHTTNGVYDTRTVYVDREQWDSIEKGQRWGDVQ